MLKYFRILIILFLLNHTPTHAQTWVDSMDTYAREKFLPAKNYHWTWQNAALLNVMVKEYDHVGVAQKEIYLGYIKKAMDKTYRHANGKTPNAVASGLGMAFLWRVTGEKKYQEKCEKIYSDYLKIRRTKDGAVSHLQFQTELWDDTVFMIGEYLLGMYRASGDVKYIDELARQIQLHREKLQDKQTGLWYHGWDSDNKGHCTPCSQHNWPDKDTRRSHELWGRGNGWIVVTLADALQVIPKDNAHWDEFAGYLKEMIVQLPALQDKQTGHWYQLPVRNTDPDNWIESSCTAMFAYGINAAVRMGIVRDTSYKNSVDLAYKGLRPNSMEPVDNKYLTTKNVCKGTCIGDKDYYFKRKVQNGKSYAVGMFILFGLEYEVDKGMR